MLLASRLTQAWTRRGLAAWLLWPVARLYGGALALRRGLFRIGWFKIYRAPVPVIVVGNVVAGGTGKTPIVMALVRHLQSRGLKAAVVSRGYGRTTHGCLEVLPESSAVAVGDEPVLIRRACSAPVFVASKRAQAVQALLEKYPATQVIVCDDGLQHTALARDLEVCVFDDRGVGNGFLMPAGPLRQPWPRRPEASGPLARPPFLLLHSGDHPALPGGFRARRSLADHAVRRDGSQVALSALQGQALGAVAAIAQPQAFFDLLKARGLTLAQTEALDDHYNFNSWISPFDGNIQLICTEKDAVKLWQAHAGALAVPLVVALDKAFLDRVDESVNAWLAARPPKLSSGDGHTTS